MLRLFSLAMIAVCAGSFPAQALELKNVRPCYGPFGAARLETKCVPGDFLFVTYDIENLRVNNKTFRANYTTTLELIDSTGTVAFEKKYTNDVALPLGGTRMPGDLHVILPPNQKPGKHKIRLTVKDLLVNETKSFEYAFEVVAPTFSFVGVSAKAVGFAGESYLATFALVGITLDAKNQPSVDIVMRILDDKGKNQVSMPLLSRSFPNQPAFRVFEVAVSERPEARQPAAGSEPPQSPAPQAVEHPPRGRRSTDAVLS